MDGRHQRYFRLLAVSVALVVTGSTAAFAEEVDECGAMMENLSIVPYQSWGSASAGDKKAWEDKNCNRNVCLYMQEKYDVDPGKSWGSLPANLQKIWDDPKLNCNMAVQ
jgi:hypothetical protein